jgi:hypothetical protein
MPNHDHDSTDAPEPYGEPVGFDEPAEQGWLARALDWLLE